MAEPFETKASFKLPICPWQYFFNYKKIVKGKYKFWYIFSIKQQNLYSSFSINQQTEKNEIGNGPIWSFFLILILPSFNIKKKKKIDEDISQIF